MKIRFISFQNTIQSELRYSHYLSLDIHNRAIPCFSILFPQPHIQHFIGHMLNNIKSIPRSQSNKDKNTFFSPGDFNSSNSYPCLKDPLNQNSHDYFKNWINVM